MMNRRRSVLQIVLPIIVAFGVVPSVISNNPRWREITYQSYMPRSGASISSLSLGDDDTRLLEIGFTYNWFGNNLSQIRLSTNGQLNMNPNDTDDNCCAAVSIGSHGEPRIAFVQEDVYPPSGGDILVSRSMEPLSFKVTFNDIYFFGDRSRGHTSVELFPNGDIILCYGTGSLVGGDSFAAGVEDPVGIAYPVKF